MLKKFISDSPQHEILFLGRKVKDTNIEHAVFSSGCLGKISRSLSNLLFNKPKNSKLTNTISNSAFKIQLDYQKELNKFSSDLSLQIKFGETF